MWILLLLLNLAIHAGAQSSHHGRLQYALFNNGGIRGNVTFEGPENSDGNVTIVVYLSLVKPSEEPMTFSWGIHTFPVFYDSKAPCASAELGSTFHDLSKRHGQITIPGSQSSSPLRFEDEAVRLRGPDTIWGRSLLLKSTAYNVDLRACANIGSEGTTKTVEITFSSPVVGSLILRQGEPGETTIFANVFHASEDYTPSSNHEWRILATDILDTTSENSRKGHRKCDYLQALFDPNNVDDAECSKRSQERCKIGDMTKKHGLFAVGSTNSRYSKRFYVDMNLPLSAIEGQRTLYLALYEKDNPFRIMGCAKMRRVMPKEVRAPLSSHSVKGHFLMSQSYRTQPTVVTVQLKNLRGKGTHFRIHEFPVPPRISPDDDLCSPAAVGPVYNPFEASLKDPSESPTSDALPVGDLSAKFGLLDSNPLSDLHIGIHVDFNLPLFGTYSVIGRSLVIYDASEKPWICATIGYPSPTRTAVATFVYPVAGQVIFRQPAEDPYSETTVFAELHYVDGSVNATHEHRWDVHERESGPDFYNWTKRCESTGAEYNPHDVGVGRQYEKYCHPDNPYRCALGDLTGKFKRISVAASSSSRSPHRAFYTDVHLPLSGWHKILGKGLVIHDDQAPPHRGNRLACTGIRIRHPVRASVRQWQSGTAIESNVTGVVQFKQEFLYDPTEVKVDLSGLNRLASGYHVHEVWVPEDREFPCTSDSVYGHFNPFRVNVSLGPAAAVGSADQYEVGDLSGKFGTLEGSDSYRSSFLDNNLPLHGMHSAVGRSVVIHQKERNFRWTCGTIVPEYKADISREVVGIASFHQPGSAIHGYVRLRMLEYADGGYGDTSIEVDLRYPGKYDRNVTSGHSWAVYVNQVAHDAVEKVEAVRCIAAGYRWNPYNVKSGDDSYEEECGVKNPLRCEMGDLAGRHGSLTIGSGRRAFTDINLPLVGNYSVMGRSLIIFAKAGSPNKLACANIKPDIHLKRHFAIKKNPGFTASRFMDQMRTLLEAKDWLVVLDAQSQRDILEGQCIQLTVHFYGPDAYRLQTEFSNLINLGSVQRSTRLGTKMIETFYKPCRNLNDIDSSAICITTTFMLLFVCAWISSLRYKEL